MTQIYCNDYSSTHPYYFAKKSLIKIITQYINMTPFSKLIDSIFSELNETEIMKLIQDIMKKEPVSLQNMVLKIKWDSWKELLIYNSLTCPFRGHIIHSLLGEKETKTNLISILSPNNSELDLSLSSEEERIEDELAHWNLFQKIISNKKNDHKGLSKEAVKFILLEAFSIHAKLIFYKSDYKRLGELLYKQLNLHFQISDVFFIY